MNTIRRLILVLLDYFETELTQIAGNHSKSLSSEFLKAKVVSTLTFFHVSKLADFLAKFLTKNLVKNHEQKNCCLPHD